MPDEKEVKVDALGAPGWAGLSRIVLATPDLEETIRFYGGVLGMVVDEVRPGGARSGRRECLVRLRRASVWALHFLEHPEAGVPEPEWRGGIGLVSGALQQIALALPDAASARGLRARLEEHGVAMTPTRRDGVHCSMRFLDDRGMVVEAWWPAEEVQAAAPWARETSDAPALAPAAW
jgi:catechol 2,3-dioxygenase-like lactoylglutathione lyase family enzyme